MIKIVEKLNRVTEQLAPMCLFSSAFFYIILWYLNLHTDNILRRDISIVLSAIFLCLALIKFASVYYYHPCRRKIMTQLTIIPAVWLATFVVAILQNGFHSLIIQTGGIFIVYCLPVFMFTVIMIVENSEKYFIGNFKWFGIVLAPAMIYYVFRILMAEKFSYSTIFLGRLTYMDIAYMCLPIIIFCVFDFCLHVDDKEYKYNKLITGIICLFITTLLFTGTKGTTICLGVFLVCLILYYLFIMKEKNVKIRNLIILMLVNTLLFSIVWVPPASGMKRIDVFAKQIAEDYINNTYQIAENEFDMEENDFSGIDEKKLKALKMLKNQRATERLVLYELAILEARDNPLLGMGSMGYNLKYGKGFYPHNIFLEALADWGYPIGIILILFVATIFKKLYLIGKNNLIAMYMVIYFVSFFPKDMLSGSIYADSELVMLITYYFSKKYIQNLQDS